MPVSLASCHEHLDQGIFKQRQVANFIVALTEVVLNGLLITVTSSIFFFFNVRVLIAPVKYRFVLSDGIRVRLSLPVRYF